MSVGASGTIEESESGKILVWTFDDRENLNDELSTFELPYLRVVARQRSLFVADGKLGGDSRIRRIEAALIAAHVGIATTEVQSQEIYALIFKNFEKNKITVYFYSSGQSPFRNNAHTEDLILGLKRTGWELAVLIEGYTVGLDGAVHAIDDPSEDKLRQISVWMDKFGDFEFRVVNGIRGVTVPAPKFH